MRVLVLGGSGMLGHKLWQVLGSRFDTWATVREWRSSLAAVGEDARARAIAGVDACVIDSVEQAIAEVHPNVVVNAIGIVKQLDAARDAVPSIEVNALFPHRAASVAQAAGARFIHVSTDCVFSGKAGHYVESDIPDPVDLYGRSKLLGEVTGDGALTLRTSIVGRELESAHGLVEWFLSNAGGGVCGFTRAVFSGLPTATLAGVVGDLIEKHATLSGLYHVAAEPIDKCTLLGLLNDAYDARIEIEPLDDVVIDRSLDGTAFSNVTGFVAPSWQQMVNEMAADTTAYVNVRV